jgi:hypothetical protein
MIFIKKYLFLIAVLPLIFPFLLIAAQKSEVMHQKQWIDITQERLSLFDKIEIGKTEKECIKKVLFFNQQNTLCNQIIDIESMLRTKRVVLFAIHGTWGQDDQQFHKEENQTFQSILEYAKTLGDAVEVVIINWSGKNLDYERKEVAKKINTILSMFYFNSSLFEKISFLGYSHGGNIINLLTQELVKSGSKHKIHDVISIFTPVRQGYAVDLEALSGNVYHFYGAADMVQYFGSFDFDLTEVDKDDYSVFSHFPNPLHLFYMWEGRTQRNQKRKISFQHKIMNFRTRIDGKEIGHLDIKSLISMLPQIIKKASIQYLLNDNFDLNLNTESFDSILVIRDEIPEKLLFAHAKKMQFETDLSFDKLFFTLKEQKRTERLFSKKEKALFRKQYQFSIGSSEYPFIKYFKLWFSGRV